MTRMAAFVILQTVLGYEQDELINRNLRSILHPHDVDYVMAHIANPDAEDIDFTARYLKKGYVCVGGTRFTTKVDVKRKVVASHRGDYVWISIKGRRQNMKILGVGRVFEMSDKSDRYGVCTLSARYRRLMRATLSSASPPSSADEFYAKFALNGTCTYVSANVRPMLGFASVDLMMKDMSDFLVAEEAVEIWEQSVQHLDDHTQLRVTHRMRTKCGEYRWLESVMWPFLNPISRAPEFLFGKSRTTVGPFTKTLELIPQIETAPVHQVLPLAHTVHAPRPLTSAFNMLRRAFEG